MMDMDITLTESLTGFTKVITHLDGRLLRVTVEPGTVTRQDQVKCIQGEGMPYHGNPFTKGRLFLHFKVKFPTTLPPETVIALKACLPKAAVPMLTGEEEKCALTEVDLSQFGQSGNDRRMDATEEDDEDGRGGQRVQCAQG